MLKNKFQLSSIMIGAALMLQACASNSVVADSDRDVTGKYDGTYQMDVAKMSTLQLIQNWQFTCNGEAYTTRVDVKDGQITYRYSDDGKVEGNVASNGRFRLEIPLPDAQASGRSATSIADGRRKWIIAGNLEKGSGRLVVGIAQFAWNGCSTNVKYAKQG